MDVFTDYFCACQCRYPWARLYVYTGVRTNSWHWTKGNNMPSVVKYDSNLHVINGHCGVNMKDISTEVITYINLYFTMVLLCPITWIFSQQYSRFLDVLSLLLELTKWSCEIVSSLGIWWMKNMDGCCAVWFPSKGGGVGTMFSELQSSSGVAPLSCRFLKDSCCLCVGVGGKQLEPLCSREEWWFNSNLFSMVYTCVK